MIQGGGEERKRNKGWKGGRRFRDLDIIIGTGK